MSDVLEQELGVTSEEMALFAETAAHIGLSTSEAIRVFLRRFNAAGGFPFAMASVSEDGAHAAMNSPSEIALLADRVAIDDPARFDNLESVRARLRSKGMAS